MRRKINYYQLIKNELMDEIESNKLRLECVNDHFEQVADPDLIDSCIYEIDALHMRYKFLLTQLREFELTFQDMECTIKNERELRRYCDERGIKLNRGAV